MENMNLIVAIPLLGGGEQINNSALLMQLGQTGNNTVCQLYYRCKTFNVYISAAMFVKLGQHSCINKP